MLDNLNLSAFLPAFMIFSIGGLVVSLCAEQSQIVAKMRGMMRGKIASGYSSAMKIMLANRFGTIIFMFFLALSIDIGIPNITIINIALTAFSIVIFYNGWLLFASPKILLITDSTEKKSLQFLYKSLRNTGIRYAFGSYLATLLNLVGLTLPLLLSNSLPEYRLSMANTGFLLNAFFTFINVLLLETKIASLMDNKNQIEAYEFTITIFVFRTFAILTVICLYLGSVQFFRT